MASSSRTGQRALQPLPSKSLSHKRRIGTYSLPDELVHDRSTLKSNDEVGMAVLKVTKTGKLQPRRLAFSPNRRSIYVTTHRIRSIKGFFKAATGREATVKVIPLESIDRIQRGPNSKRFWVAEELHAAGDTADLVSKLMDSEKGVSLSIVYRGLEQQNLEMLDLVVPSVQDYEVLRTALEDLVALCLEDRQWYTGDVQLLHGMWTQLNKEWEAPMNLTDWLHMTERLHVPLSKSQLSSMFRAACAKAGQNDALSLSNVAELLQNVRNESIVADPVEELWSNLVETDPIPNDYGDNSISAVSFLSFLRTHQKEYPTKLEEAIDLIQTLNQQQQQLTTSEQELPKDRLSRNLFSAYLASDANDWMDPIKAKEGADDMTQPLSHYWISTSHDTYLETPEHSRFANPTSTSFPRAVDGQAYTAALLRGVRCLELDIWDGPGGEPIIGPHSVQDDEMGPQAVSLIVVLRSIRQFLEQHPYTFPIILNLENHCSEANQKEVAKSLYGILGAAKLIHTPEKDLTAQVKLPSPESSRGKVILLGKRPKDGQNVVVNDDFDVDNDEWEPSAEPPAEKERDTQGTVIWFDAQGPIRTLDPQATIRTPSELLQAANDEARQAQEELEAAKQKEAKLRQRAHEQENLTAQLTLQAGLSPSEVKKRAAVVGSPMSGVSESSTLPYTFHDSNEKTPDENNDDQGIEVHEVFPELVQGEKDRYSQAAQEALDASNRLLECQKRLHAAEAAQREALNSLAKSRAYEQDITEKARLAAAEARSQREHAISAQERVQEVRQLLQDSQDKSSSAGTVVQTAMTEARISEKRAADAQNRSQRAQAAADKERNRADDETRREEDLEQQVAELHDRVKQAEDKCRQVRGRLDKANAMIDRANEQIRLIETSSQYRQEKLDQDTGISNVQAPFLIKHRDKLEERNRCRALIGEATEELKSSESKRAMIQSQFEEKARSWRVQAERASQARRAADRSAHLADELVEHAEEEREAASLRQVARQRAEAAVESRGTQQQSLEAQLAEAERAAAEAAKMAVQCRNRAESLTREAEMAKDHSNAERAVETQKWETLQAQGEYESASLEKEKKDKAMVAEKRRLDTASELYESAERNVQKSHITVEPLYEEEAISAFNTALLLREEADNASKITEMATNEANSKYLIAKRAREYHEVERMSIEISSSLAKLTLLHSTRFRHWNTSLQLSNVHVHSMAQGVVQKMMQNSPGDERMNFHAFTKNHLMRVFPSWRDLQQKGLSNNDPVYSSALGCQMVAMNLHSADENTVISDGRFRQNGSCGFVLKPRTLTHNDAKQDRLERWSMEVLSGRNLPANGDHAMNPFVVVSLSTGRDTEPLTLYRTDTATANGFNPVWERNQVLVDIEYPSVAMISLVIWNKVDPRSDEFVAAASIPASCLREGFRSVALFDATHARYGLYAHASLLLSASKRKK